VNIPRIDGIEPERLLAIIEAIQKQREPVIEKSDAPVAGYGNRAAGAPPSLAPADPAATGPLPTVGRFVNIWA